LRERSDETFSDRLRDGTPREPSASLLDQVAQLGPGRRPLTTTLSKICRSSASTAVFSTREPLE
jgi:hypothetical protein